MQNYSHFIVNGEWVPVSKGDKRKIAELLLTDYLPEMAAISVSGQKHVAFRAKRNPPGQSAGWVQFEERTIWVEQDKLRELLSIIERLYTVFSKQEIETGNYSPTRILQYGVGRWYDDEEKLKQVRKTDLFQLALFISQRSDEDGNDERNDCNNVENPVERNTAGLQEPLSDEHLGAVPGSDTVRSVHKQSPKVRQYHLFEDGD